MRKKLQIFISSTFADLVAERQVAVEAVLKAGHIPAGIGIEPFFLESPMETIRRWIDESDVYILILGGIYGTMLPDDSKSYTHWEYDYAGELGKPRFALVLTDEALRQKPYDFVIAADYQKFQEFKQSVIEDVSIFHIAEEWHVRWVIHEKLKEYKGKNDLDGWVSGKNIPDVQKLLEENASLLRENARLHAELKKTLPDTSQS
ncbi:DUF4062 domain-containing protein [Paenibacillus sp. MZ04-78.2]|uniref:DUF4062 domain-containing protein n=1 Tax=Paenibacillus sp. MZ04-78.2 TaxID=2962034 RepID=UPI0020B65A22|nr:DUF4062 domain-containing protein [Paenibacillus sp. MZ04-78.2]MCP3774861.1 DUF4062 domain-containing protein [Paenibacillus sp. MZ04-78.2]